MQEEARKLENDEDFDLLTRICARLNFDFRNRVEKLEDFLMMDPSSDIKVVKKNLKKVKQLASRPFYNNVYPQKVIDEANKEGIPPRCIYLPTKELMRKLITYVAQKSKSETNETFLVKFGLLEEPLFYLKHEPEPDTPLSP